MLQDRTEEAAAAPPSEQGGHVNANITGCQFRSFSSRKERGGNSGQEREKSEIVAFGRSLGEEDLDVRMTKET